MSIRDLGFIKWRDEFAKYENTKSSEFFKAVEEEESRYNNKVDNIDEKIKQRWLQKFADLPTSYEILYSFKWLNYTFSVRPENAYCNKLETDSRSFERVQDYGTTDDIFWIISDNSNSQEKLSLSIFDKNLNLLKEIENVGDTAVSFLKDVYFIAAEKTFWFNRIHTLSGKIIYSEKTFCKHETASSN